jgi:hypothetical protein
MPSFVTCTAPGIALRRDAPAPISESVSVVDPRVNGQEIAHFLGFRPCPAIGHKPVILSRPREAEGSQR